LIMVACEKVPLLAPTGSSITLSSPFSVLASNGSADVTAQVVESAGTPPHSGTQVTFTTTLGSIQPAQAETDAGGRVTVKFNAGGASGTATIAAVSGGASTGTNGSLKILVGTAAVGRVVLSANPTSVGANGGSTSIAAAVLDVNGSALPFVPVAF